MTLANNAAIDPGSVISAETGRLLPRFSPSFLVSSSLSTRRPASTTVNPAFISASDAARPTPVPAPATRAILFPAWVVFSGFMFLLLSHACRLVVEYSDAPRAAPPTTATADRENTVRRLQCGDGDRRRRRRCAPPARRSAARRRDWSASLNPSRSGWR